jgi:hypothetical protein
MFLCSTKEKGRETLSSSTTLERDMGEGNSSKLFDCLGLVTLVHSSGAFITSHISLTAPSHVVTHLICSVPVGKKYLYALSTQRSESHEIGQLPEGSLSPLSHPIHIVNELWILDCIRFQRRVEESHYLPLWLRGGSSHHHEAKEEAQAIEDDQAAQESPSPPTFPSSVEKKKKSAVTSTKALKALLHRVQGSTSEKRSLEFRYGDEDLDDDHAAESNPNHQQESEVIEEEAMAEEIWNEKKIDPHSHISHGNEEGEDLVSPMKSRQPYTAPIFLLGGGSHVKYRALEQEARDMITSLGGTVLSSTSSYNECTHLILWELKRTEKFLCCCVSGKVS